MNKRNYSYEEIVFNTKDEANGVLECSKELLHQNGFVTVADLLSLSGVPSDPNKDNQYGWPTLDGSKVYNKKEGFFLSLPPISLRHSTDIKDNSLINPDYYKSETGLEAIDVIEAFTFNLEGVEAVYTGNVLKYACRWKNKGGAKDLKKLIWYAKRLLEHVEKLEGENDEQRN